MANPTLNSFISPTYYNSQTVVNPLYIAFLAGSTYTPPTFGGVSGAASTDPGGLFGWLIYSRTALANPAKGATTSTYIVYTNPYDLINDVNNLGGVTACILTNSIPQGGTFGFFSSDGSEITGKTNGNDVLSAIYAMAYGGTLILAGSTLGFSDYQTDSSNFIDVMMCKGVTAEARYLENANQIIGIFPSVGDGAGYTALNFDSLFSSAALVSGATVSDRIVSVSGQNYKFKIPTSSLQTNTTITTTTNMISDVVGAFTNSKESRNIYFSIAGLNNSTVLNGIVKRPIDWTNTTEKNIFKKNRVNFYIKSNGSYLLGLDLVGATAGSNSSYTSNERIGTSKLRQDIETNVREIMLRYVFQSNVASTRSNISKDVSFYIQSLNQFLDTSFTQITCDASNNQDNSSEINIEIIVKPLIASEEFVITVSTLSS